MAQESQDTSCSQPSCFKVISPVQGTSSEAEDKTSQGTICPTQTDFHGVIYLSSSQYSTPATSCSDSVLLSGLQIYKEDVETVQPKSMITDTVVLFLFK